MKTQDRPLEIVSKLDEFSVEVSCLLTGQYRLVSQSIASYVVFEGDFWGAIDEEFSHRLGQKRSLEKRHGTSKFRLGTESRDQKILR